MQPIRLLASARLDPPMCCSAVHRCPDLQRLFKGLRLLEHEEIEELFQLGYEYALQLGQLNTSDMHILGAKSSSTASNRC